MPTYAYACSACEHAFDIRQTFSDDALTTCPACEQESLRKVFSPVGVVFKGSGFYRNDSRAAAKGKSAGSHKPSTAAAATSSDSSKADTSPSTGSSSTGSSSKGSSGSDSSGGGSRETTASSSGSGGSGSGDNSGSGSGSRTPAA